MYARAQETMLKMRDVAKDGMVKAAKTAKQGMASIERSINAPPARSAAASRPTGQRTAVGVNPPGFNGDSTVNGALDNDVAVSERLQGAEAAAEMLFEMRAANDGNPTPEEAEMLSELRAVCEQHLNVLARSVERGAGLISETLLMKCSETAESETQTGFTLRLLRCTALTLRGQIGIVSSGECLPCGYTRGRVVLGGDLWGSFVIINCGGTFLA